MPKDTSYKLILEDGTEFVGSNFGALTSTEGKVYFSTSMFGHPEQMTDPTYAGSILVYTYPLIGNYGIQSPEYDDYNLLLNFSSEQIHAKAIIVSEYSDTYSHYQAQQSLGQWLKDNNIPALTGIDTRALAKHIQSKGEMWGKIIPINQKANFKNKPDLTTIFNHSVSTPEIKTYTPKQFKKKVLLLDFGATSYLIRNLLKQDLEVIQVPYNTDINTLPPEFSNFDAIFLSNGPELLNITPAVKNLQKLIENSNTPIIGIGLGMEVLARVLNLKLKQNKTGHRSNNQPVVNLETGNSFLASQNHSKEIQESSFSSEIKVWFRNANDNSIEGFKHTQKSYAAVHFIPETQPEGPTDTIFVFNTLLKIANLK